MLPSQTLCKEERDARALDVAHRLLLAKSADIAVKIAQQMRRQALAHALYDATRDNSRPAAGSGAGRARDTYDMPVRTQAGSVVGSADAVATVLPPRPSAARTPVTAPPAAAAESTPALPPRRPAGHSAVVHEDTAAPVAPSSPTRDAMLAPKEASAGAPA